MSASRSSKKTSGSLVLYHTRSKSKAQHSKQDNATILRRIQLKYVIKLEVQVQKLLCLLPAVSTFLEDAHTRVSLIICGKKNVA
jgi:hypothetical protein